jgi:hypothetical protein
MTTIDDLYTQLALAKKEHAPLAKALDASKAEWLASLTQLGLLPDHRWVRSPPSPPRAPAAPVVPPKTYVLTDLPGLAAARLKAQSDHDASAGILAAVQAEIQAAIAAKGA